jgi:hypothetical protein
VTAAAGVARPAAAGGRPLHSHGAEQCQPRLPCPLQSTFLEVQGVVNSPNSLTEESCCPFGDSFGEQLARLCARRRLGEGQPPPPRMLVRSCPAPVLPICSVLPAHC